MYRGFASFGTPSRPRTVTTPSVTGGATSYTGVTGNGVVITTSSEGFSSPPSADQMSASERDSAGGTATVSGRVTLYASSACGTYSSGSISCGSRHANAPESSRCSSSGRLVHAVRR